MGEDKGDVKDVLYSYTAFTSRLEDENRILRSTIEHLKQELTKLREPALMVCEINDVIGDKAVIKIPNGNMFYVNVSSDIKNVKAGDTVLVEQKNLNIVRVLKNTKNFNVERFVIVEKPKIPWKSIGGLNNQIEEVKEVIELPLKKPELFKRVGIQPPKGVLLYGLPGTGKTLLAKAVASSTNATFIEIVGSELVQKFIGEGAKLVKDVFELARKKSPAILFIDELDAIAARRVDVGTSGEREVQRTFMQLLAEIDGFKHLGNVKVIGCTNRKDILDPAITRPGRLDRLIEIPAPNPEGIVEILKIHTAKMHIGRVNLEMLAKRMDGFVGADIKAVATEAGYFAIREGRTQVNEKDFLMAIEKVKRKEKEDSVYREMFG